VHREKLVSSVKSPVTSNSFSFRNMPADYDIRHAPCEQSRKIGAPLSSGSQDLDRFRVSLEGRFCSLAIVLFRSWTYTRRRLVRVTPFSQTRRQQRFGRVWVGSGPQRFDRFLYRLRPCRRHTTDNCSGTCKMAIWPASIIILTRLVVQPESVKLLR
jgi:hypothetical protein